MRKLGKISLQNLSQAEMEKRELNALKGGDCYCHCFCTITCGCKYAGEQSGPNDSFYGGSSQATSSGASLDKVLHNEKDATTSSGSGNFPTI